MNSIDIIEEARGYLGTPFVHQGRTKGKAIDCAGLVACVAHGLGISDYDKTDYSRVPDGQMMEAVMDSNLYQVGRWEMSPGDVLLFGFYEKAQHLGIVTSIDPLRIIHAYSDNGEVVEHILDRRWERCIRKVYRYPVAEAEAR